ncbi:hypothetical protein GCM10007301_15610 [Azorhizobium oxalatiphilum]|uniref:Glycine-rich domain-containing protein n=1 Tax=Azorhizobium oxalatiphilum TaxID=980631 RepID=A0A917BUW2_9HYPH|nr:hypothetical protein [Azorhizobium oxalatiphilum]GGF56797.1 hypothetical protein GCM10007301_15610 [Azorhizobium oxalatiphilum]
MKYNPPYGSTDPNAPYLDRSTPGAISGSRVPAVALEHPQRELVNLLTKAGLTPSAADLLQVVRAVRSGRLNYLTAGGTANAITLALDPAPAVLDELVATPLRIRVSATNTLAVTVNVNGLGALPLLLLGGAALVAGHLPAGGLAEIALLPDKTAFQILSLTPAAFPKGGRQRFSSSGTFTVPAGVNRVEVVVLSGGGGGGGANSTGAAAMSGNGGAMGAGSYAVTPGQAIPVIVGGGGSGGPAGANNGGAGGASSFGSFLTANGALGGLASGGGIQTFAGANATVNGANIYSLIGSQAQPAYALSGNNIVRSAAGPPPNGTYGDRIGVDSSIGAAGNNAVSLGQGGSGAVGNAAGGQGAAGYVDVTW